MAKKRTSTPKAYEQLAMYKTAGELRAGHDVWPGDSAYDYKPKDNFKVEPQMELPLGNKDESNEIAWRNIDPHTDSSRKMTQDESWDKKLRGSKMVGTQGNGSYLRKGEPSLHESIASHGVLSAVQIQALGDRHKPTSAKPYTQDKPFVTGGHHRIAAAADINPNMLVPVEYHKDVKSAMKAKGFDY